MNSTEHTQRDNNNELPEADSHAGQTFPVRRAGDSYSSIARSSLRTLGIRLVKNALFFVYLYSGFVALRDLILSALGRSRAVVLYYHRIDGLADPVTLPLKAFQSDLTYLKERYECISLAELCARLRSGRALRHRMAVITFDDGYRDNYTKAIPALKEAGLTATFFVATGFIGTDRSFHHDERRDGAQIDRPKLTWDDLRAMQRDGFEIGSHTVNHVNLGNASTEEIQMELAESLATLNRELGRCPRPFSFPWGKPENMSSDAIGAVQRAGYYSASSAYGGRNAVGSDPYDIRRVDAGNGNLNCLTLRARIAGFDPDYYRILFRALITRLQRESLPALLRAAPARVRERKGV